MNIKRLSISASILLILAVFSLIGCDQPVDSPLAVATGVITGKVLYQGGTSHAGIAVTLEQTDGLRTASVLAAARGAASSARSVVANTVTTEDGSYQFPGLAAGIYTVHASFKESKEKAVTINITVAAGQTVTAEDLKLTPTGSLTGKITLDGNSNKGNEGFQISVASTSYMAVTDTAGNFTISDIPIGSGYLIIIIKGSFTTVWVTQQSVSAGKTGNLGTKQLTSAEIGGTGSSGNSGLQWKGNLAAPPANPQVNWAYYNTTDKTSYIWSGGKWDILAAPGAAGQDGAGGEKGDPGDTESQGGSIAGVTVNPGTATVAKGGTQTFTATVTGTGNPTQIVTWTVEGGVTGTAITTAGVLTVALGESATTLTVRATSTVDSAQSGTAIVTVNPAPSAVTSVSVNPGTATVAKGGTQTFTATVTGTGNPAQTVTWTVEGGVTGTAITIDGVLTVALGESAKTLTVKAASTVDSAQFGTAIVTVTETDNIGTIQPGEIFPFFGTDVIDGSYPNNSDLKKTHSILDPGKVNNRGMIVQVPTTISFFVTEVADNVVTMNERLYVSVSVGYTGVMFSAGAESNYTTGSSSNLTRLFGTGVGIHVVADKYLIDSSPAFLATRLASSFEADIATKSAAYIIDTYGTHLIIRAYLGGNVQYFISYSGTEYKSDSELKIALNASYAGIAKGQVSTDTIKANTEFSKNSVVRIITRGGNNTTFINLDLFAAGYADWVADVTNHPTLAGIPNLNQDLVPLWDIVQVINPTKAAEIKSEFDDRVARRGIALAGLRYGEINKNASAPEMVPVEPGTFPMGSTDVNANDNEKPVITQTVSRIYVGKYEVTQEEFMTIMGFNPSKWKGDKLPVENVSFYAAIEFCNRLSQREGLSLAYTINGTTVTWNTKANGYRLPTEAEWEYMAKGGNREGSTYIYSGSDNPDTVAWYSVNSGNRTHVVGTKAPNSLGIYDMSGNVWEWCWDEYGPYTSGTQIIPNKPGGMVRAPTLPSLPGGTIPAPTLPVNPVNPTLPVSDRVARGGSWFNYAQSIRSTNRGNFTPSAQGDGDLGFRVVRP
jgi:formylglycine-generating enzyme required for sulfatase activity